MKKIARLVGILLALFLVWAGPSQAKKDIQLIRVAGRSRYETAARVADVIYENRAQSVVIVSGENYPDGLTGGVLASVVDGPVLLTGRDQLPLATSNEIRRIKPEQIYILGGPGAISPQVEAQLARFGQVTRLGGSNRYETAAQVADYIYTSPASNKDFIGLANGLNFPDALAAAGYFANIKTPLLLTGPEELARPVQGILAQQQLKRVILVGGEESLASRVLGGQASAKRLSGANRYTTSLNIAREGFKTSKWAIITSGESYADALASAPLAHHLKAPILLAHRGQLPADLVQYIKDQGIENILVVGGQELLPDKIFEVLPLKKPQIQPDPEAAPLG